MAKKIKVSGIDLTSPASMEPDPDLLSSFGLSVKEKHHVDLTRTRGGGEEVLLEGLADDVITSWHRLVENGDVGGLHAILAEESGVTGDSDTVWIIDPLDGTTNFLHGFPQFCVSVAVKVKGRVEAGAVYDPMRQELFAASRGNGATLDDRKIRVSGRTELEHARPSASRSRDVTTVPVGLLGLAMNTTRVAGPTRACMAPRS